MKIPELTAYYNSSPLKRALVVAGDINFLQDGKVRRSLSDPLLAGECKPLSPANRVLDSAFRALIELESPCETHYHRSLHTASCIDRIFTSTPQWLVSQLSCVGTVGGRLSCVEDGLLPNCGPEVFGTTALALSDHLPFLVGLSVSTPIPRSSQPILRHQCESKAFRYAITVIEGKLLSIACRRRRGSAITRR